MVFEWADLATVAVLVILEGLLSGDNVLVLAVMVLPLPEESQRKALRYGILGAFALRAVATFLAVHLAHMHWVSLLGGLYLLYLVCKHFGHCDRSSEDGEVAPLARGRTLLGLSLFWSTVIKVELTDLVFAVDSILVAVAMTSKAWVIIAGGILGILMMRLLVLQVLALVKRYPKMVDGAYVVVLWVGIKLICEYLHDIRWLPFEIPRAVAIGVVIFLFAAAFLYARAYQDPEAAEEAEAAESLFAGRSRPRAPGN